MGAYLSNPITEKSSSDEKSSRLSFGASSMQGWRVSQEDAHNCIVDFDKDTSFFAVYDGHGGSEVAKYCALHLPDCFRSVVNYKNGNISQALEDAFLEFDNCLTKDEVVDELKHLSAVSDISEDEGFVAEDAKALREEAHMPIEELLARYKGASLPLKVAPHMRNYHNQKPRSPMLRAKKTPDDGTAPLVNGENSEEDPAAAGEHPSDLENGKDETAKDPAREEGEIASPDEEEGGDGIDAPESSSGVAEAGCSHPKSRTKRKSPADAEEKAPSGSEDGSEEDEEEGDEEYSVGDSSSEDEDSGGSGDDKLDSEDEEDEEESDSEDDEDACLKVAGEEEPGQDSGCTAVVAVLQGNQLYVANAGDSRCVVSRGAKAVDMSFDHKPEDKTEKERILKAGGEVTCDGRVNGGLNLSRAIGDHSYKKNTTLKAQEQMISAQPDVQTLTVDPVQDDFMVLACDGIWNTMSSQEVVDFVDRELKGGEKRLSAICEKLFEHCLAPNTSGDGTGCDNMTCIIVRFHDLPTSSDSKKRRSPSDASDEHQNETSNKKLKSADDASDEHQKESSDKLEVGVKE